EGDSSECRLSINGNVLVTAGLYPKFNYGDELKIKCELQTPEPFDEFAYDRYLARYGIYSLCYRPQIETAEARPVAPFRQKIYGQILQIKNKIKNSINYGLPEPESSLLQAIILGNRRGLDENLLNTFSRAGISHIIAISGMHIAIISVIIMRLLLRVGASRRWSFVFSVIFLALYIMLIGIPASALRAGLMVFMVLLATELGRLSKAVNSLIFAAVILLMINPLYLRDDIGFQLSFLAVLSILYIYPILNSYLDKIKIPKLKGARDIFTVTMAAQVLTLPLIALYFHQVSVISPLVNIVVLFLLPFVISGGMAASLLGMIFKDLAWLIFTPVYFVLKYIIVISEKFVSLPFAYLQVDYIWPGWVIIFYIIITWLIFKYSKIGSRVDV
ncbi:MAG: ComEC/Rec2 family competence protein, partial [bacterium]|nr:ComEC/Rec2 family competence protein [bacterium]